MIAEVLQCYTNTSNQLKEFYAAKNIFSSSHAQSSLTSIISHCQKATKHIPQSIHSSIQFTETIVSTQL